MKLGSWLAGMGALVAMVGAHGRPAAAAPEVVEDVGLVTLYANDPIAAARGVRYPLRHERTFDTSVDQTAIGLGQGESAPNSLLPASQTVPHEHTRC